MINKLSLKYRLILPVALLGMVALISNLLAVSNIRNVNANAANIADNYMRQQTQLSEIRRSIMDIHKMALSHIVATDYETMITLVRQIKEEEKLLDEQLAQYNSGLSSKDEETYQSLLSNYDSFKHALVFLVCASAGSKTQDAYAYANGDVATFAAAAEENINTLYASVSQQTSLARAQLSSVYLGSMITNSASMILCVLLVVSVISLILRSVVRPIKGILHTIQGSSGRINDVVGEVLKRTRTSTKSATDLSFLAGELSSSIQKAADNAAAISKNSEETRLYATQIADECNAIAEYSTAMKTRADEMELSAKTSMEATSAKTADMMRVLAEAIEQSKSVEQINSLTDDILSISSKTTLISLNASLEATRAGKAGKGFSVVAGEIRQLADSSRDTANRIQQINEVITDAVYHLSQSAQNLVDYMDQSILKEFEEFVEAGSQYRKDASYIENVMDEFNDKTMRLQNSMTEIADSIGSITKAMDDSAAGISRVAGSTQHLVSDMADITGKMDVNQEVAGELSRETVSFANL
ncbi:MAG: MCP four helix bundle domain-containing protein [Lachnospiraceae bacterium]|nr:MCP four helix bundle domain-containing protein [Lachnospiraceae bacterium]